MDAYHIALFIHIVTLIAAACATAVSKLAVSRRIRARTVGEALEWHDLLIAASKVFPVSLVLFTASGAYMVSVIGTRAWLSGFVIAGLVGVVLLLASGTFLGLKANALRQVLQGAANVDAARPAPRLVPPPLVVMLPVINTGIALAVVFDMVTKPASVTVALAILALGIAAGVGSAWRGMVAPERGAVRGMRERAEG